MNKLSNTVASSPGRRRSAALIQESISSSKKCYWRGQRSWSCLPPLPAGLPLPAAAPCQMAATMSSLLPPAPALGAASSGSRGAAGAGGDVGAAVTANRREHGRRGQGTARVGPCGADHLALDTSAGDAAGASLGAGRTGEAT